MKLILFCCFPFLLASCVNYFEGKEYRLTGNYCIDPRFTQWCMPFNGNDTLIYCDTIGNKLILLGSPMLIYYQWEETEWIYSIKASMGAKRMMSVEHKRITFINSDSSIWMSYHLRLDPEGNTPGPRETANVSVWNKKMKKFYVFEDRLEYYYFNNYERDTISLNGKRYKTYPKYSKWTIFADNSPILVFHDLDGMRWTLKE